MRFLIVGASGLLGGAILKHLNAAGHQALGTRANTPRKDLIHFDLLQHRIEDCLPEPWRRNGADVCAVICACICQIDRCYREREITYQVNVVNTIRLIEDLRRLGMRVVFISTGHVFDGRLGYYTEDEPYCPLHEYGRHKTHVERWLRGNAPETLVLRPGKIVSDDLQAPSMFREWWSDARRQRPIVCIAGQILGPTEAEDVARALLAAAAKRLTGVYHVSNPEFFPRDELARQFLRAVKAETPVVARDQSKFSFAEPRPLLDYLDSTKFVAATGMHFTTMGEVFRRLRVQAALSATT